jgi:uncharacterized protein YdeI (YjbR/CyaY-like superfamily)
MPVASARKYAFTAQQKPRRISTDNLSIGRYTEERLYDRDTGSLYSEDQYMNRMNPKVDFYFSKAKKWQEELAKLRVIVLDCGLTEELKWGVPCYTFQKSNIVLIHVFKEYCALLFVKGALLNDANGILVQQTENVQAARQIRFTNVREIVKLETILKAYVQEAIEVEKAGLKVNLKKTTEFNIPEEFLNKLDEMPTLKEAFDALTPGRQRAYLLYFSAPKQSKTRAARVEKCVQPILNGRGLND